MAFEAPSGLMGRPTAIEDFEAFSAEDVTIYLSNDVLDKNLENDLLYIYIEGYGRYTLQIID